MNERIVISEIRRDYIESMVAKGKRIDGRGFEEVRDIKIEKGIIDMAEGSARVDLGRTSVFAGIKFDLGRPYPNSPNKGVMTTHAELSPLASPTFDGGPPGPNAIELARVVDRGIRESGCIDLEDLVLEKGEKVWTVYIDIHVTDENGNLFDASGLAALAALTTAKVPASRFVRGEDRQLPLKELPIPVTMVKIGDTMLVDPGLDEEMVADARITITTDGNGNVRAMQKGMTGSLTADEVSRAVRLSRDVGSRIRERFK